MVKIAPSLFAGDTAKLGKEIKEMENAGVDMLHIDIMDGHFVPNLSFGPSLVADLREVSSIFFDIHLMVNKPDIFIGDFAEAGADLITFHIECDSDVKKTIYLIKKHGKKVGISINPDTSVNKIYPYLNEIDMILIMTIKPGFGGQEFIDMSSKIKKLRNKCDKRGLKKDIQVDGGINLENIPLVTEAGANVLVSGSKLFLKSNYKKAVSDFRKAVTI